MTSVRNLVVGRPAPVLGSAARGGDADGLGDAAVLAPGALDDAALPGALDAAAVARGALDDAVLLARIEAADLRGRGGAGFPAARKLRAVRDAGRIRVGDGLAPLADRTPIVVANGEEGEPGSVKDRWLLRTRPRLVLEGLLRAASITGADRGYVYLADPTAARAVRDALAELDPAVPIDIVQTDHTYVAGEETSVVRRIEGGPAIPRAKPPRPFESGVGGAPTLVANVETLVRIALLADDPGAAGSLLVTLSARDHEPLLVETTNRLTLRKLASELGIEPSGVLMGGLFGGILGRDCLDLTLEPAVLAQAGTGLGCGAIRFLLPDECPVTVVGDALDYLAAESSRQCGVCVSGTAAMARTMRGVRSGVAGPDDVANLLRWADGLRGRGACGLLDAAANLAGSLTKNFSPLLDTHIGAPCRACAATPPDGGARLRVEVPGGELSPISAHGQHG